MIQAVNNHAAARSWYPKAQAERQTRHAAPSLQLVGRYGYLSEVKPRRSFGKLPLEIQLSIVELLDFHALKRLG